MITAATTNRMATSSGSNSEGSSTDTSLLVCTLSSLEGFGGQLEGAIGMGSSVGAVEESIFEGG